jgi:hypothetical protein
MDLSSVEVEICNPHPEMLFQRKALKPAVEKSQVILPKRCRSISSVRCKARSLESRNASQNVPTFDQALQSQNEECIFSVLLRMLK